MATSSYLSVRASLNRKPDAPYRWLVARNRLNAVLFVDQLSENGLQYRRQSFKMIRGCIACLAVMIILVILLALTD
jgi:hypothetical protein